MTIKERQELGRLCCAKLYEFELFCAAEDKICGESSDMARLISECSVKTLGDYRTLLRIVKKQPRSVRAGVHSERIQDIIDELINTKKRWISLAQSCAFDMSGREKDLLLRICESEQEEIYKLQRCLS